ncbi:chloride channel protein [Compostibacter hankyongensis]|uniref:Chloride channel protein n=1 Tax=Compostibacter hankyongensis TaxID=1007089 RepID=A0ABP8FVQ9_9BACT
MPENSVPGQGEDAIPVSLSLDTNFLDKDLQTKEPVVNKRIFYLSLQAIFNALIIGVIAKILVALINLITNISFYGEWTFASAAPSTVHLGVLVIVVPVLGAIIVGIMARYGHAGIRGHGIPEAMEQVLLNESRINPLITFLKPISSAISIGTGGPFGAEGPIIATGGALGSLTGQIMRITAAERKIMLAAGACAGMAAIFGSPVAAVLLAIELLLFEFSPRSIIPVALSCATGAGVHFVFFESAPVFQMPAIPSPDSMALLTYTIMGLLVGVAAAAISKSVYAIEDLFERLPIHWMWWPALGAVAVGVIGYFAPETMGVGYDNIRHLLTGSLSLKVLLALCILKYISWAISLGSGTSGGTLAPLFTIGGGMGALLGMLTLNIFPGSDINIATAALIGMAAMFAGASRALLTSIVFALETTGQTHGLLPLLCACTAAYFVSFFLMKRGSIMTEKIERRGVHAPDSYEPDILQKVRVKEVLHGDHNVLSGENSIKEAREWIKANASQEESTTLVLVDHDGHLLGVIKRADIFGKQYADDAPVESLIKGNVPYIYEDNELSIAVDIMDKYHTDVLPVVTHDARKQVTGILSHKNIFAAYRKRRDEDALYKQAISLKRQGIRVILRGRQLLKR